ncbi:MAG: hypothetical protein HRT35_23130 [Algicola sp.]|nr:hypothetical protein [Algicola sp.]
MIKRILTPFLIVLISLLSACGGGEKEVKEEGSSPEYAATKFFYSVYDTKDLKEMQKYATPKMKRIIQGHGSINAVTRHMFNMQFDSVEIEVDKGRNLRQTYGETATIVLIFTGTFQGGKVSDMRTVKLVKLKGDWLVAKLMADPWAR